MLTIGVQFDGDRIHPGQMGLWAPFMLVAFVVCVGAVAVPLLGFALSSSRSRLRRWRGGGVRTAAGSEQRARAMMSELCPHGWRAQITLYGDGEDVDGSPAPAPVALDWTELEDESGRPAVMRRVWAPTVGEALEAMVADRQTDETLEQIEQGAVADGATWPDV